MNEPHLILWRWMDRPGHEASRLESIAGEWHLRGTSVLMEAGQPCSLSYDIVCDGVWRTQRATVRGWVGARQVDVEIETEGGRWRMNGAEVPAVEGCVDVDLNFSPCTNLLPIRRLGLPVGGAGAVSAAWLRFPGFQLERLDQAYRRTGERTWRYESADGAFVRDLEVDEAGFPTRYPGFWDAEPAAGA
ncbi:MAG TPA: putative glycolipid-binding domain-containing protein [Longimicrobium sp.]|nr:putative glycolipid-binding domain-containing protein [Longimicrobium sp.]